MTAADRIAWWGAPLPIGASHVLARMAWMARARPEVFAATRHVLTPKDYCLRALVGEAVADPMSNFFVVGLDLAYVDPLVSRVAGARERLPPLKFFTDIVGEIALGSSGRRAPVVAGTMDAWSGLFGAGVRRAGQGVYISGTSEIVAIASAERIGAPGIVTFPTAAGLTVNAGPTQSGGDLLALVGRCDRTRRRGRSGAGVQADRNGRPILFLPHLEGERAPLWDAQLRGAFIGLDRRASGPEHALAVLEGVALSARMLCEACDAAAGETPPRLFHAGGGARSDLWAQIKADCLGRPLERVACLDVGCLGAAIMAAVGVGAHPSLAEAIPAMTRVERSFEPDPRMRARYDAMYDAYSRAAKALRPLGVYSAIGGRVSAPTPAAQRRLHRGKTFRDPVEIRVADVTPIVEGDLAQSGGAERPHRRQKLRLGLKIRKRGAQDAAQRSSASQPALDVVDVRLDPRRARFVEAGFDDPSRFRERLEIASLVPGAGGRAGDRGDDRDRRASPHGVTNFADQ